MNNKTQQRWLDWDGHNQFDPYMVPLHTQEALENYIIRGYPPGGFLSAALANDFIGAATRCDQTNRECLPGIAAWLLHRAPQRCWGSSYAVRDWLEDRHSVRTQWAQELEKQRVWSTLQQM